MATMEKEEGFLHDDPYSEMLVKSRHGDMAASHGQIRKAQESYGQARQVAQQLQIKESEAWSDELRAWAQARLAGSEAGSGVGQRVVGSSRRVTSCNF